MASWRFVCWVAALPLCVSGAESADKALEREIIDKAHASILPEDAKGFLPLSRAGVGGPEATGPGAPEASEFPQSLEVYQAAVRVRPTPELRTIVLQPLGEFNREQMEVLELLREYAAIFFQQPARLEKPIPLELPAGDMTRSPAVWKSVPKPRECPRKDPLVRNVPLGQRHGTYDRQYNGDRVIFELLAPRLPRDTLLYLGVTMADLYCGEGQYVFGVASLDQRVGVLSLCRYYPEFWGSTAREGDEHRGLRRACKILNHETGHMFGLRHCVFYRCAMNYSNSLQELDGTPIHYCPICHRKLMWNTGFDPFKRYAALREFYQRNGLTAEAAWLAGRLQRWKTVAAQENLKKIKDE